MAVTKNLGPAKSLKRGTTPPTNIAMLWYDTSGVSGVLKYYDNTTSSWIALAGANEIAFDGNRPITRASWPANINLGTSGIKATLEALLFPAVAPSASISGGGLRQFGANNAVTLNWTATRGTNAITAITVNGQSVVPTGNTQSGTQAATATQNVDATFSMNVTAGSQSGSASTSVAWRHKRFWFKSSQDLTTLTDLQISAYINDAITNGINGEFATGKDQPERQLTCTNEYVYFVYLGAYGNASFVVNGLPNSDWNSKDFSYVNSDSFTASFKLYRSGSQLSSASPFKIDIN